VGKNNLLLSSLSSFNNKKICLQYCIVTVSYQYAGFYLHNVTTFSRSLASSGRELQPPIYCTSLYVYYYIGGNLQKATTFFLPPRITFHKFSDWIHQQHHNCNIIIKYICINQSLKLNQHFLNQPKTASINHFDNPSSL